MSGHLWVFVNWRTSLRTNNTKHFQFFKDKLKMNASFMGVRQLLQTLGASRPAKFNVLQGRSSKSYMTHAQHDNLCSAAAEST